MIPSFLLPITLLLLTPPCLARPSLRQPFTRRGSCPPNFRNTVFNTVAPRNAGWPGAIWDSLSSNGVSNWVGFTAKPVSSTTTYNLPSGQAAPVTPGLDSAQIPICMDPSYVNDAVSMLTGPSPPPYMELFNEPDFSYMNFTPLTSPQDAAAALAPIFRLGNLTTQLISPALAFTNSDWLSQFDAACGQCIESHIDIMSAHLYSADPGTIMTMVQGLHNAYPGKKIWVTELAPASSGGQGCTMGTSDMVTWMNTVVPQLAATGYVDRVFWNTGEYSMLYPDNPSECNPSLTNADGSATDLLKAYGALCS